MSYFKQDSGSTMQESRMECNAVPESGKEKKLSAAKIGEEKIAEKCWKGVEQNGKAAASDITL